MLDLMGEANAAALIGLLGGVALGLAARVGRFCTLGAIEDCLYGADTRRLRMWGLAIGGAILGTHLANAFGLFDSGQTAYLSTAWNPLATIIGGLMFGYGMAMSGNCGYGALARLGGGDLRALMIAVVMGLSAYVVMSGPLAQLRVWLFPVEALTTAPQSYGQFAYDLIGLSANGAAMAFGLALMALAWWRGGLSRAQMFWAFVVGTAIVSGWIGTFWIASAGFGIEPIESHSFAMPIGDTIYYGMTASGNSLSFSVGSVVGVVLGALIGSWSKGHFRWEACEDPRELRRQMAGAALMGPGAILAMGCSVGQSLSAFSVLAYSAPVACAAIFAGAALGLRQLISGFAPAE